MITTRVSDARKPQTRAILKTASSLGIRYYRRGGEDWGKSSDPLARIRELHPKVRDLVELNREYNIFAGIHNHSGFGLGAAIWDLHELVKPFDARYIGSNYDIGHATAEGGYGAWRSGFRLLAAGKRIGMVAVKDLQWRKRDDGWRPGFCPLGEGMVDLATFFGYLKGISFAGPISLHFEYSSAGSTREEKQQSQLRDMKRDLERMRGMVRAAGLT
jgi:sugar phosphate isomerase/epimerase